jgi:hypothetical protein
MTCQQLRSWLVSELLNCHSDSPMETRLKDVVELVKEDIFWPEGQWSFRRGDLVWGRTVGWRKYYEVDRKDSYFTSAEDAMKVWEISSH